jgi:fatty acid desaturase
MKTAINIEKRFNVWVYIAVLYLSFLAGTYLQSEIAANSVILNYNMLFGDVYGQMPYFYGIIIKLIVPVIHVALFELFARIFYVICNAMSFGAIRMTSKDFAACLRIFVILANFALGALNLLYYFFNFLIPLGFTVLGFAVYTAAYFWFFTYIYKHYLDKKTAHRAFRTMAVFYMAISLFNILGGLLL